MADQNIGGLTALSAADVVAANDRFIIWDASETGAARTKGMTVAEMIKLIPMELTAAAADETTALTASTTVPKLSFRMPFAMALLAGKEGLRVSLNTAPAGSTMIVDVHVAGASIMDTTKISVDAGEATSYTAATEPTISTTTIAKDALVEVFCDQVGSSTAGAGLKITFAGYRT